LLLLHAIAANRESKRLQKQVDEALQQATEALIKATKPKE
jgi:hypothetical protein